MNTPQHMEEMCIAIKKFISECRVPKRMIARACFNISGRVDTEKGVSHSIFAFEDNDDMPIAEILGDKIGIRSVIENDTRAMLCGEISRGGTKTYRDCLYINASWGLGLGILMDGKVYRGFNGFAGEFGHINAFNNEIICHCGKKGCLETEVSGNAARRIFLEQIAEGKSSVLCHTNSDIQKITPHDIIRAANNEDTLCQDIMEHMGRQLGRQLANLINIFNPEAVIIGGSMSKDNDLLLESVKMGIKKYSLKLINRNLVVERSSDPDRTGVTGACMVARERFDGVFRFTAAKHQHLTNDNLQKNIWAIKIAYKIFSLNLLAIQNNCNSSRHKKHKGQQRALAAINQEQLAIYYGIGRFVSANTRNKNWGKVNSGCIFESNSSMTNRLP